MNTTTTTSTIEYILIEKEYLRDLKPGFPIAWKAQEWGITNGPEFLEGHLIDYLVRSNNRALVRGHGEARAEWVNKFRLYRILLPQIEDIDQIYNYDE